MSGVAAKPEPRNPQAKGLNIAFEKQLVRRTCKGGFISL